MASYIIPCGLAAFLLMRQGHIDWAATIPLAIAGSVGTYISAQWIKPHLDGLVLTFFLGLCIIAAGSLMFKKGTGTQLSLTPKARGLLVGSIGFVVGMLTGLTGGGGNAMLVPTLVTMGLPILTVIGACQIFSVLTSICGTVANISNNAIDLYDVVWLVCGQVAGTWIGVRIAQQVNTEFLKKMVGVVCVGSGILILFKSVSQWLA